MKSMTFRWLFCWTLASRRCQLAAYDWQLGDELQTAEKHWASLVMAAGIVLFDFRGAFENHFCFRLCFWRRLNCQSLGDRKDTAGRLRKFGILVIGRRDQGPYNEQKHGHNSNSIAYVYCFVMFWKMQSCFSKIEQRHYAKYSIFAITPNRPHRRP